MPLPGTPVDGEDNVADLTIENATLELLASAAGQTSLPIFMRVTTYDENLIGESSHRDGAGEMLFGVDDAFAIYNSSTSGGGCTCAFAESRETSRQLSVVVLVALLAVRTRRRRCE